MRRGPALRLPDASEQPRDRGTEVHEVLDREIRVLFDLLNGWLPRLAVSLPAVAGRAQAVGVAQPDLCIGQDLPQHLRLFHDDLGRICGGDDVRKVLEGNSDGRRCGSGRSLLVHGCHFRLSVAWSIERRVLPALC
eukprot:scaffold2926_cov247-Pinguiococcus_pyrenoidosus.AAC.6